MKLAPVSAIVAVVLPAAIELGLRDAIVGPLTAKALAEEETALEFWTVTLADPAELSRALATVAVSEVGQL
jgi:hypothetical protein